MGEGEDEVFGVRDGGELVFVRNAQRSGSDGESDLCCCGTFCWAVQEVPIDYILVRLSRKGDRTFVHTCALDKNMTMEVLWKPNARLAPQAAAKSTQLRSRQKPACCLCM